MKDFTFQNKFVKAALYFLESGDFLFRAKVDVDGSVTSKTLAMPDVAAAFTGKEFDTGFIPDGIKRFGTCAKGDWALMVMPNDMVKISLVDIPDILNKGKTIEINIELYIPSTALIGIGNEYWIFALGGDGKVYDAPFPNVDNAGKICFGDNKKLPAAPKNMRPMWDLFFRSPFNQHLIDGKSRSHPKDVREMLLEVSKSGILYPVDDLQFDSHKIENVLSRLLGGNFHAV